ncbi:DNase I-like protein [Lepidopterella palustris CBS 459.81]|uniref:DNase I-like protein n=1 Tax=Lepidopterella palustris CBS 459.81 TaxID=1314670 RepID=A0A8E2E9K0_9PEZI|nr:DNase I-like protein [Lepidopterella palustris CBS 459.81]
MERQTEDSTDGSSIKPVSSLRSHFESMLNVNKPPSTASTASPRQPSPHRLEQLEDQRSRFDGRVSLDIPRDNGPHTSSPQMLDFSGPGPLTPGARAPRTPLSKPKPRPSSMVAISPPRSPPRVTIQPPRSPPKPPEPHIHAPTPSRAIPPSSLEPLGSRSSSPQSNDARHFRIPSRSSTPALEAKQAPFLHSTAVLTNSIDPRKPLPFDRESSSKIQSPTPNPGVPPPINRAGKPKITSKLPSYTESGTRATLAPDLTVDASEERVSPFSTPPSSEGSVPGDEPPPPSTNEQTRARMPSAKYTASSRDNYFAPPPKQYSTSDKNRNTDARSFGFQPAKQATSFRAQLERDLPEDRPGLPPRRDSVDFRSSLSMSRQRPEPPVRRSMDQFRPSMSDTTSKFMPPPKRTQTFAAQSPSASQALRPPNSIRSVSRTSSEMRRPIPAQVAQTQSTTYTDDSDDTEAPSDRPAVTLTDYPDSSQANRRPPVFRDAIREIPTKYETKLFAVCGEYICTSGYITRVWSLLTGELLMSLSHGDTVKVTAIAFRPARDVEDEGKRLWLGTNLGELHEVDIPSKSVVYTKPNAHPRSVIIKIYRYAAEMWSLDEDGKLHIWPADETGIPSLSQTPNSFRVPKGHTFSIISGTQLWIASGKDIRVFQRSNDVNSFVQVTQHPLSQPNVGEATSGAILSSQPDRIYFGHIDGKVTIYAKKDFSCLGVVSVSLYKISSLVGVGDHLWAGYITGMIYVYDTSCTPWKVKKDWHAHDNPIAGIVVDRSSIWKLDRLQVASLGTDNMLRLWDGMLKDDWLEAQMQDHDGEFCDFREVTAVVMTWNAGASKPNNLRHDEQDSNFFRELLEPHDPPDILVFGFQELVDLEDKKVTARSFFKKGKKKDATEHEHMSHQYRAWRDHLVRSIDEHMPASQSYTLLHTANLVGLFTCVFVKSSERSNIRDVSAAEVKLGMGGLHGNKGALIVRFIIDDSSICFINCHLAAGQTQTVHRNNDIASIMETDALPAQLDPAGRTDLFVGGGDGSMILDHEICILNGDLNYRIDAMPRNTVIEAVKANNLSKLLDRDQLLLSRKKNPGFRLRAFTEAPITFAPTYKYDVGTDNYDSSEKKRSPAWCDRLLYRGLGRIKQVNYRRHEVRVSDHRPVSGKFKVRVKTISSKRQVQARERCEKDFENVKQRIAKDIKLDYLINVFGLSAKEAQRLLKL